MPTKSTRTIEYLIGILATAMIVIGLLLYTTQEASRIESAQAQQLLSDLDSATTLYAENCAICHGMAGEGIGATVALNNPGLASMNGSDLFKIIARGRYNTSMPAWSISDGGPMSDFEIGQLVTLIQTGDWQAAQDRVVNLGLAPRIPFAAEANPDLLEQIIGIPGGDLLAQGIVLYAENCVACHGPDGTGTALAPALNDPNIRSKDPQEIERVLLTGVPTTLMAGWSSVLNSEQISSLLSLISRWDEVPSGAIPAPERPAPTTSESLALGEELYSQSCSRCHGPEGQGTQRAPALNVKSFLGETNDGAMQYIISLGIPGTAMPAWGDRMSEAEIMAIVGFIRAWEPNAPEVATPAQGGGGPWWANNGTNPALPSGGVGGGQGKRPSWAGPQSNQQPITENNNTTEPGAQATVQHLPPNNQPDSEANSPQTTAPAHDPGITGQQTQNGEHTPDQGGGPPWANNPMPETKTTDWRQVGLVSSSAFIAFSMIAGGAMKLRKIGKSE